ncbi:serine/threonine-protein kinase [Streptomyces indicus]|uniref:Protein kinase domain-containing protein n=1 Tax=Streptomyces indicus TaxID=417292 RepID=A0A1G9BJW7_9ACTN|nr:serine/threonine-protein kinase [Streptomyces indicus]SDK39733.1 Protein kinase domain-containing protein [Streptomyces indicus]
MRTPVSDPLRVGGYRIVGRLGSGGMGWVYLARSRAGRPVAVKVVRPELVADHDFRLRFAREVAAASAVSGAFTAAVVDADPDADLPWLATMYVPGPSLSEAVRSGGPLTEPYLRRLGAGLAEALMAIHAAGIVHRDLKPSNVLLAADGPRVIDFGISRLAGSSSITQAGIVMGTPPFMSPEQLTGGAVGPPTDVFALGGVLAFAATGRSPFGAGEHVALRVQGEPPDLDGVPEELRRLLVPCLAKDQSVRPALGPLLELLAPDDDAPPWPPPSVAAAIRARERDLDSRQAQDPQAPAASVPSCLQLHAQALLDAGLTDAMVAGAVARDR